MTENEAAAVLEFNRRIIEEFRANGGKVGGDFAGVPLLLLTTVGARTGLRRTSPLAYVADGERVLVVASNAGGPTAPAWYHNLLAEPKVTVERGTETYQAIATVPQGAERDRLFAYVCSVLPIYAEYQAKTSRVLPVVVLEPVAAA